MSNTRLWTMIAMVQLIGTAVLWVAHTPLVEIEDHDLKNLASTAILCTVAVIETMIGLALVAAGMRRGKV